MMENKLATINITEYLTVTGYMCDDGLWFDYSQISKSFNIAYTTLVVRFSKIRDCGFCQKSVLINSDYTPKHLHNLYGILEMELSCKNFLRKDILNYWSVPGRLDKAFSDGIVSYECPPALKFAIQSWYEQRVVSESENSRTKLSNELWEQKHKMSSTEYKHKLRDIYKDTSNKDFTRILQEYNRWFGGIGYKVTGGL